MRVSFLCCPFRTSFGAYGNSLKSAIEAKTGSKVQWVASNCGCGDPVEAGRQFLTKECDYFDMPIPSDFRSNQMWKRRVRGTARTMMLYLRARKYESMLDHPDVSHFQQVLNGYGSKVLFNWLKQPTTSARVVTVHELDADQTENPETNRNYNRADAVIVHCAEMKDRLVSLQVQPERIHVVLHGTDIPAPSADPREGILFYGGHKLMSGKGIETLFKAMCIIAEKRPGALPRLKIHGHYGDVTPADGLKLAASYGLTNNIAWLNQLPEDDLVRLYQSSLLCVLPFSGSFAGLAASLAAACQLPVVCTRKAGLPDHLADAGIWVDENNAEQLANRITELLDSETLRREVGARLLKRAQDALSWDVIADRTLSIYDQAIASKSGAASKRALGKEAEGVMA
jgi:glycosyltransferase involved in cell wall biosynthesis